MNTRIYKNWDSISTILNNVQIKDESDLINVICSISDESRKNIKPLAKFLQCNTLFFNETLPFMLSLMCRYVEIFENVRIPLFKQGISQSVSFTREQIACLLSFAFFCAFNLRLGRNDLLSINFSNLYLSLEYNESKEKLHSIINYFHTLSKGIPEGKVTYIRKVKEKFPSFTYSMKKLSKVHVRYAGIETCPNSTHVDFANKKIGGGVLDGGCVQEEILFSTCPELILARLFCEEMKDNESIEIHNYYKYSKISGYAFDIKYDSPSFEGPKSMLAIDAIDYRFMSPIKQYSFEHKMRELKKAFVGFEGNKRIATGQWGCGAFMGDKELKAIIQIIAASEANCTLIYNIIDDDIFAHRLELLIKYISDMRVSELYAILLSTNGNIFNEIKKDLPN